MMFGNFWLAIEPFLWHMALSNDRVRMIATFSLEKGTRERPTPRITFLSAASTPRTFLHSLGLHE